jgi:cytochrome b subunit of formate dehydrogenase
MNWLKFTNGMSNFGSNLKFFGNAILYLIFIITSIFFWFIVFSYYQPYQEVAVVMIKFIRLGVQLFVGGFLIHYVSYFINELLYRRQMNKVKIKIKGKKK